MKQGLGCFEVVAIVLIILKICKVITISWWLVLAPVWLPMVLYIIFYVILIRL